jgi:hypothetical protein
MDDILLQIVRDPLGVLAIAASLLIFASAIGTSISRWVNHRIETARDEREERQARERAEQRHRHRLEKAEKLETVASIVIADKSLAEGLRDKIELEYPKVRVEQAEEGEEAEEFRTNRAKPFGQKRSKRR